MKRNIYADCIERKRKKKLCLKKTTNDEVNIL